MKFLRKYGEATTITFGLRDTDGVLLKSDAVYAAGDVKISKDEGADTNITAGFVDEGLGYSMVISSTEMEAARIQGYIEDQGTPVWLGREFTIETYGHANAQYPYMNEGIWDRQLTGATHNIPTSAGRRLRALGGATPFAVNDATPTNLSFISTLTSSVDNFYNDTVAHGTSGDNTDATRIIIAYNGTTKEITFDEAWPDTIADGDDFDLRAEHIHPVSQIAFEIWDEILTGGTHNIVDSAARRLRNLQEFGSYENGNVYIDTINGNAGTTDHESGTIFNAVDSIADANTIGASLHLTGRHLAPLSSITFAASQEGETFCGNNWTLALGGQSISGTHIQGANVSGICSGANEPEFHDCHTGIMTIPPAIFVGCDLRGLITLPVGEMHFRHCSGDDSFAIDFGAAIANTTVNMSDFSGVITVSNLGASGTDILNVRGHGRLIFDASCVGGTVNWDGHFTVINNGSGITITPDDITTSVIAIQGPTFDTNTDSLEKIRDRGDEAWVTGSGSIASVILAEKVETLLDINKPLDLSKTATTRLQYQWLDIDGDPVNINGSTFKFKAVKNASESSPAIAEITGTISDAPNGRFYFDVLPTTIFKGRYEIWAVDGSSVITVLTMAGGARIETHPRL
jgi:hypothetical protein